MEMRPKIQLQSMMKSMKDTVIPAIDPNNRLAHEQGQLIIGMMNIMIQRIELEYRYDRDELNRILRFAALLQQQTHGGSETIAALLELEPVMEHGTDVFDRAQAEPSELVKAVRSLRSKVGKVIQAVFVDGEPASKQSLRQGVLTNAREQLLNERSWLIMQGWEADPAQVPPIESLIAQVN